MKVTMLTSHIPPYQSANAILPQILASYLVKDGHEVDFILPEKALTEKKISIPYSYRIYKIQRKQNLLNRIFKIDLLKISFKLYKDLKNTIRDSDLLHIHSNGLLHQVASLAAHKMRIPVILTFYGTEIWHYKSKKLKFFDPFIWMNNIAQYVTYYSKELLNYSLYLGIKPRNPLAIYPPAAMEFKYHNERQKIERRKELGITAKNIIVNVKRLHPLGGHRYLLEAMPYVLKALPDTHLYICGDGELRKELEDYAITINISKYVTFLGMVRNEMIWKYYAAADLYVLPSILEALPTVAVEALACGTPVIITDTPGGKELDALFPDDLTVVKMKNSSLLAEEIIEKLKNKHRTSKETGKIIDRLFRPQVVYNKYLEIYQKSLEKKS